MLNPAAWRILNLQSGERVQWLKAMPCDCYDPTANYDAQRSCTNCDHGWVYRDQGEQRALVAEQRRHILNPELGWVQFSELKLTTLEGMRIGTGDKVVLLDRTALARERLHRGADTLPHLYPVEVLVVADGSTVYAAGSDYRVNLTTRAVTWVTAGPDNVYAVEYTYRPEYWFMGDDLRPQRPAGLGDGQTPQRGTLSLDPPSG